MTRVRLWLVRETELARLYCKVPESRSPTLEDEVWVPKSIIEHAQKRPPQPPDTRSEHTIELPDWFAEKAGL